MGIEETRFAAADKMRGATYAAHGGNVHFGQPCKAEDSVALPISFAKPRQLRLGNDLNIRLTSQYGQLTRAPRYQVKYDLGTPLEHINPGGQRDTGDGRGIKAVPVGRELL